MAQTLLYAQRLRGAARPIRIPARPRSAEDPTAAARGILLALALSCIAWVAIAMTLPLLW
jgi:hypothetical protein